MMRTSFFLVALSACVAGDLDPVREAAIDTHVEDWRDEVIYQLMVDRFANGTPGNDFRVSNDPNSLARYKGGDWLGIIDQLDYLEELGITSIWISPIVLNVDTDAGVDGYHGYWAIDLDRLNPHFGDLATLRQLVAECHARDIKVIVDIVTNHLGQVFYYDINRNGRPDEATYGGFPTEPSNPQGGSRTPVTRVTEFDPDWDERGIQSFTSLGESGPAPIHFFNDPSIFRVPPNPAIFQSPEAYNRRGRVIDWNDREQVVLGDFPGGLKDLDTLNPEVQQELIRAYSDWVLALDLDGFRIDTLKHVEHEFWQVFAAGVRARLAAAGKDNFLMFGEAFDGDDELVGSYTTFGEVDSVFYFPQKWQVFNDIFGRELATTGIETLFNQRETNYGTVPQTSGIGVAPSEALINFMDNHDVPRFRFEFPDPEKLRTALTYLFTEDGIPCLYYGTEQDFDGGNDPANREPLWESDYRTDGETFQWIARLARIRRHYEALRRGSFEIRWTTPRVGDEQDAGIVAFERVIEGTDDYVLVVINTQGRHMSETSATSLGGDAMTVGADAGATLIDVLTGDDFDVRSDQTMTLRLDPHEVRILVPEDQYDGSL